MKPTNEELEAMGFNPYADKQKADTLSQIPKIDTEVYPTVTNKVEPDTDRNSILVNDYNRFNRDIEKVLKPRVIHFPDLPTNPLEDFINDYKADGFTFENGTLTKHTHTDPYPFLTDLKDCLDVLLKADLDLSAIQNVAELILENGLRKVYKEATK